MAVSNMQNIQLNFFKANTYAVAGASNNTSKYGYILLDWYHSRNLDVVPITPTSKEILGLKTIEDISQLEIDEDQLTSLSIVTPPKITRGILEQALNQAKLNAIWLQPGAEDQSVIEYINDNQWLKERTVYGGPCVLVLGDKLRNQVQEEQAQTANQGQGKL